MTDVLKFLNSIRDKREEVNLLKGKRNELYYSLMPSGIRYDLDRVQTSPEDRIPVVAGDLDEIQHKLDGMIASLMRDVNLATELVNRMQKSKHRQLILLRYFGTDRESTTWEKVAKEMGYTPEYVRGTLHGEAIKEARTIWNSLQNHTDCL